MGANPESVAVNETTNTIYVTNRGSATVSVIDGTTGVVTSTISTGSMPASVAVNETTNTVYVANQGDESVSVIDGATNTLTGTITVAGVHQVAVNAATNTVYATGYYSASVAVIDGASNTVTTTIAVDSYPSGVAVDTTAHRVYVSSLGDHTLTVINSNTNAVAGVIAGMGIGVNGVAVDESTHTIFANSNQGGGLTSVVDGVNNLVTQTIAAGAQPVGVAVNATTHKVYVAAQGDDTLKVLSTVVVPVITTGSFGAATVGSAYSQTVTVTGTAPISFAVSSGSLPAGLTLDSDTGVVSGTPTGAGSSTFTITATNSGGSDSKEYTVTVADDVAAPVISLGSFGEATVGSAYSQTVTVTGTAPITFAVSAGSLPAGLVLDSATGLVSGTPAAAGSSIFTITATNGAGSTSKAYTVTVAAAVTAADADPGLATTGFDVLPWGVGGAVAVVIGAGLVAGARYRRSSTV